MASVAVERRLSAILAADAAGYSRLTSTNDVATIRALTGHRKVIDAHISSCRGRIVNSAGDGLLAEFRSVVDAVKCAIDIQRSLGRRNSRYPEERQLKFRIGVSLGDVIVQGSDIYGDGVNIAARLQALADPGGIYLSGQVHAEVANKLRVSFEDLGMQSLKNIAQDVRVYRVQWMRALARKGSRLNGPPPQPDTGAPSVAILPFDLFGSDSEQQYFADGLVEDIITALSRFKSLLVIARNSSFAYRGRNIDIKEVSRALGVRYVVEGSVRKAGQRVRVTAQLIRADTATHLWADHFDCDLEDIFELQDRVVLSIVTAIEPRLRLVEIERSKRKPTGSLEAYDYYLRALPHRAAHTAADNLKALALLRRAISLDPSYGPALAHAAMCYAAQKDQGWTRLRPEDVKEGLRLAQAALEADMDDATVLSLAGQVMASLAGDFPRALELMDQSLRINANQADTWSRSSMVRVYLSDLETAVQHADTALRLNPVDRASFLPLCALGFAHLFAGRYEQATIAAQKACQSTQRPAMAFRILAVGLEKLGRLGEAREAARFALEREPGFQISTWRERTPFTNPQHLAILEQGFRKLGLPA